MIRYLSRSFCFILVTAALTGCASSPASQIPEMTFSHLPKFTIAANRIVVDKSAPMDQSVRSGDYLLPKPLDAYVQQWANDRLQITGQGPYTLQVNIEKADIVEDRVETDGGFADYFVSEPSEVYEATVKVRLSLVDDFGGQVAYAESTANRTTTVLEGASLDERQLQVFNMVNALMIDFDREMDRHIRTNLN